ncbi:DUF4199 domain-containing protein [Aestuariivivens sediminis]|uniref:DUF4199 domain-containing protein n=1 Tax=Aestuariivivens sediminis TaxID=2913557 RepID=UPI001F55F48F|nr:DUF4199 domain-containing protein [Aestuariivivens sediminis]
MKTTMIRYGIFGGLTGFVIFLSHLTFAKYLSHTILELFGYISILLSLSFIYFAMKHYRDNVNGGIISLGKAVWIGVLISLLVGMGIGMADFIYTRFLNPNFYVDYAQMLIAEGREDEVFEMTSIWGALFMVALVVVIGFMISLIAALILRRDKK